MFSVFFLFEVYTEEAPPENGAGQSQEEFVAKHLSLHLPLRVPHTVGHVHGDGRVVGGEQLNHLEVVIK